jgi:hypothetical protein
MVGRFFTGCGMLEREQQFQPSINWSKFYWPKFRLASLEVEIY